MNFSLQTPRLYLREMNLSDAENAYALNLDPDVIRYTGDSSFESIEHAANFLAAYDHYKKYGFGRWAVVLKDNEAFLGWCGLKYTPDLKEYDLGFRFYKKFWNQGYATESGRACLNYGFDELQIDTIVGRVLTQNLASRKVLEKLGMQLKGVLNFHGEDGLKYHIHRVKS